MTSSGSAHRVEVGRVRPPRRPAAQVPQESALTKRRFEPARGPAASIGSIACYSTFSYGRDPAGDLVGVAIKSGTPVLALTDQHLDVVGEFTATGTVLSGSVTCNPLGVVTATSGMIGNLGCQSGWTAPVTANVKMGSRWYSPATGQFAQRWVKPPGSPVNSRTVTPSGHRSTSG